MREYCTTPKHIADLTLKLLYVSIIQCNWAIAQSYKLKITGLGLNEEEKKRKYDPILSACYSLTHLDMSHYREAALAFLEVDPQYMAIDRQSGICFQKEVMTSNDIAIYGALCALATMSRSELRHKVLENQRFRQFLELEPHLRRAINMFCSSKYRGCLDILESYSVDYRLDLFLGKHYDSLYDLIRTKCMVQWFSAYSVVTLNEMARVFPPGEGKTIEDELVKMIKSRKLNARVDMVDMVRAFSFPNLCADSLTTLLFSSSWSPRPPILD